MFLSYHQGEAKHTVPVIAKKRRGKLLEKNCKKIISFFQASKKFEIVGQPLKFKKKYLSQLKRLKSKIKYFTWVRYV